MPTLSIQRIRDWIAARRTVDDYAFTAQDIASGVGAPLPDVFAICEGGTMGGALAAVTRIPTRYYTCPSVGFDLGARRTKDLIDAGAARRGADGVEWTAPKAAAR